MCIVVIEIGMPFLSAYLAKTIYLSRFTHLASNLLDIPNQNRPLPLHVPLGNAQLSAEISLISPPVCLLLCCEFLDFKHYLIDIFFRRVQPLIPDWCLVNVWSGG